MLYIYVIEGERCCIYLYFDGIEVELTTKEGFL